MAQRIDINLKTSLNTAEVDQQVADVMTPNAPTLANTGIERDGGITNLYVETETIVTDTVDYTEGGDKVETIKNGVVRDVYVNGKRVGQVSSYGVNSSTIEDVEDFILTDSGYLILTTVANIVTVTDQDGNEKNFDISSISQLTTVTGINFVRSTQPTLENIEVLVRSGDVIYRVSELSEEVLFARFFSGTVYETTLYNSSLLASTANGIYEYIDQVWLVPNDSGYRLKWSNKQRGIKAVGDYLFIYDSDGLSSYDGANWKYYDGSGTGTGPFKAGDFKWDVQPIQMSNGTYVFALAGGISSFDGNWKNFDGTGTGSGPYYAGDVNHIKEFGSGFVAGFDNIFSFDGSNWKYADGSGTGTGPGSETYAFTGAGDATRIVAYNKTTDEFAVYITTWADITGTDLTGFSSAVINNNVLVVSQGKKISSYDFDDGVWANSDGTGTGTTVAFDTSVEANKFFLNNNTPKIKNYGSYIIAGDFGDENYINLSLVSEESFARIFDDNLKLNYPTDSEFTIRVGTDTLFVNKKGQVSSFDGLNWKYYDGSGTGTGPYYDPPVGMITIRAVEYSGSAVFMSYSSNYSSQYLWSWDGGNWKYYDGSGTGTGPFGLPAAVGLSSFTNMISWNDGSNNVLTVIGKTTEANGKLGSGSWMSGAWVGVDSADTTAATYPYNTWDLIDIGPYDYAPKSSSISYDVKSKIMTVAGTGPNDILSNLTSVHTSSNPEASGLFGNSVAIDGDHILIGAYAEDASGLKNSGRAYLFDTAGNLLQTYESPNAEASGFFGWSVAISGDNILIGAHQEDASGLTNSGRAYLFNTSGTLLQTYVSPNAEADGNFGSAVSISGINILIGTGIVNFDVLSYKSEDGAGVLNSGRAYLFNTSGTLLQTYVSPNVQVDGMFGSAVSISGDNVLISADAEVTFGLSQSGRAYLFDTSGTLLQTYESPNAETTGLFGNSVAIDGDHILIGALIEDGAGVSSSGRAYLFDTSGTLLQTYESPNPETIGWFGWSVSIDGDNILICAHQEDASGLTNSGRAYLFNTSGTLLQTYESPNVQSLGFFGWSVAISGDNILIGARGEDASGLLGSGRAYVYNLIETNQRIRLLETLISDNPETDGYFGNSVAIDGDHILIGALIEDGAGVSSSGRVYLFDTAGTLLQTYVSPNPESYGEFGNSVSIDGDNVLVGAIENASGLTASGRAYLFNTSGTLLQTYISPNIQTNGYFSDEVAVSGDNVLIGAYYENASGESYAGRAYLFNTSGTLLQTYESPNAESSGNFGWSVAVDGDNVLIGAWREDASGLSSSGRAYLFDTSGTLLQTYESPNPESAGQFSHSVSIDGDNVLIGAYQEDAFGLTNSGRAYLFDTAGNLLQTYESPNPESGGYFGESVSIDGNNVLIGAYYEDAFGLTNSGRAYLFDTSGTLLQTYESPNPETDGWFGESVSIDRDNVLVGARSEDGAGVSDSGRAYLFDTSRTYGQIVQGRVTTAYINSALTTTGTPLTPLVGIKNTTVEFAARGNGTTIYADANGFSSFDGSNWKYYDGSGTGSGPYAAGKEEVKYIYIDKAFTADGVLEIGQGTKTQLDSFGIKNYNFEDSDKMWFTGSPYGIVYYYPDTQIVLTYEDINTYYTSSSLPTGSESGWVYCWRYSNDTYLTGIQGTEKLLFNVLDADFVVSNSISCKWAYPQISADLARHVITVPGLDASDNKYQLGYHGWFDFTNFTSTVDWRNVTPTTYHGDPLSGYAYVETTYDTGGSEYYTSYYPDFTRLFGDEQITVTSNTATRIGAYGKLTYEPEVFEVRVGLIGDFQSFISAALVGEQENMGVLLTNVGEIDAQWAPDIRDNRVAYRYNRNFYIKEITEEPDNLISQIDFNLIKINSLHPINILDTQSFELSVGSSDFNGRMIYTSDEAPGPDTLVSSQLTGEYSNGIDVGSKITDITTFDTGDVEVIGIGLPFGETVAPIDVYFDNDYQFTVDNAYNENIDANKSGTFYIEDNRLPVPLDTDYGFKIGSASGTTVILEDNYDGYQLANSLETNYTFFELFSQLYAFDGKSIYIVNLSTTNIFQGLTQVAVATGLRYIATTPSMVYFVSDFDNSLYTFTGGRTLNKAVRLNKMGDVEYGYFNVLENTLWVKTASEIITVRDDVATTINLPETSLIKAYNTADGILFKTSTQTYKYTYKISDTSSIVPLVWQSSYYGIKNSTKSILSNWIVAIISESKRASLKITTSSFLEDRFEDTVETIKLTSSDFDSNGYTTVKVSPAGARAIGSSVKIETDDKIILSNLTAELDVIEKVSVAQKRSR